MNDKKEKIGAGIITKDRETYFQQCLRSIDLEKIDHLVVVNDGKELSEESKQILNNPKIHFIQNENNLGISKTKNKALKYLLEQNCDHLFVLEDDCIILDNNVWEQYVKASQVTNIQHFNFGPGSPWNRKQQDPSIIGDLSRRQLASQSGNPAPKLVVQYSRDVEIALYEHIVAMFVYFSRPVVERIGLLNEEFYNAWEHVSHTLDIIKAGYYTPFWWFADIKDSHLYIKEAENEKANTSLAKNEEQFMKQVYGGLNVFRKLHGTVPAEIRKVSEQEVVEVLKQIKQRK